MLLCHLCDDSKLVPHVSLYLSHAAYFCLVLKNIFITKTTCDVFAEQRTKAAFKCQGILIWIHLLHASHVSHLLQRRYLILARESHRKKEQISPSRLVSNMPIVQNTSTDLLLYNLWPVVDLYVVSPTTAKRDFFGSIMFWRTRIWVLLDQCCCFSFFTSPSG